MIPLLRCGSRKNLNQFARNRPVFSSRFGLPRKFSSERSPEISPARSLLLPLAACVGLASYFFWPVEPLEAQAEDILQAEKNLFDFEVPDVSGNPVSLEKYRGKVCIVVNVATDTPFTEQNYRQLQILYKKYHDQGLEILAFPCNQFGNGEPGDAIEVKKFVEKTYNVTFPIFGKVEEVNPGPNCHPLFYYLRHQLPGKRWYGSWKIAWNFTKFVLDHNGKGFRRYDTEELPLAMEDDIKLLLKNRKEALEGNQIQQQ